MLLFLLSTLAFGETLLVDAKIPAALYIDGQAIVEFSYPGRGEFHVAGGEHKLIIMTNGNPTERVVSFTDVPTRLIIGRTGISLGSAERPVERSAPPDASTMVELRSTSRLPLLIMLGDKKHLLPAGGTIELSLAAGDHAVKVRNDAGTAIFATGTLSIHGTEDVIVQFSEGRVPEIAGSGAKFVSRADD